MKIWSYFLICVCFLCYATLLIASQHIHKQDAEIHQLKQEIAQKDSNIRFLESQNKMLMELKTND